MKNSALPILALAVFSLFDAWAYLGSGTGSVLLQLLVGGLGGALVVAKLYWHRLKRFFTRNRFNPEDGTTRDNSTIDRNRPAQIGLTARCSGLEIACKAGGLFRIHGKAPS